MASSRSKAYAQRRRQAQKRRQQQNEFQLETLEPRVLLAGNTSTEVTQILSVVPQPITRTVNPDGSSTLSQARNQIDVYFNDVDLIDSSASAENPQLYQLIFTNDTITNTDDGEPINPVAVNYNPSTNKAVLTFSNDLSAFDGDAGGPFRLRINTRQDAQSQPLELDEATIYADGTFDAAAALPTDAGSTFFANFSIDPESGEILGPIGAASATGPNVQGDRLSGAVTISGTIESKPYELAFPGSDLEPGMRELPSQPHYLVDTEDVDGIASVPYNFQVSYGEAPDGTPLRNAITDNQRARAREVFDIYGALFGVSFYETADEGLTIATGDVRAMPNADPEDDISVSGFLEPDGGRPTAIMNLTESWDDSFGGSWYKAAMREVGRLLGMGVTPEVSGSSVTGSLGESAIFAATHLTDLDGSDNLIDNQQFGIQTERIFPGDASTVLGKHLLRPESQDIDIYRFQLSGPGRFSAETIAERLPDSSLLDSMLTLFNASGEVISRNDDYFSEDSLIDLDLDSGTYFIAVTASGNSDFDPTIEDTGLNGTSEGPYTLRLDFRARSTESLLSRSGLALDGDGDGEAGGVFNFWFEANDADRTIYVDKAGGVDGGQLNAPVFTSIDTALAATGTRDIVRIIGNGGADGDINTLGDNLPYELGFDDFSTLDDGNALVVPQGVTVMVDEGAIFKMRRSYVHVGSSTTSIDRSGAAFQVLGTPNAEVIFTSREDETIGVDSEELSTEPEPGEWGGIIFQNDLDRANFKLDDDGNPRDFEGRGIFMNHISNADLRFGGGNVTIDSIQRVINPIHMIDARPTISYNDIQFSADAAISANPDSFEESRFHAADSLEIDYQATPFTSDYERVGPDIQGNFLAENTTNALSIRIDTLAGNQLEQLTVSGRFDDTDIVHAVKENLIIGSTPGGPLQSLADGSRIARTDGQLVIDPGIIVKLDGARIEASVGAQLIAEGDEDQPVVFTSINDNRFGGITEESIGAAPGDWSGIYVGHSARLSIDNAVISYGGGISRIPGSSAAFNTIELHQAQAARITNSVIENSAIGVGGIAEERRAGRGTNSPGAIFVRGTQPIIVGNQITNTNGTRAGVINIDPNSLNGIIQSDYGASRGDLERFDEFDDNQGPLIRENVVDNNSVNGMVIRPGVISTETVWDDTDLVHVMYEKVVVPNFFSDGGLRLESSPSESLVVKLDGNEAGFTTTGTPLDIPDRIGGILNVVGQPGKPVIITSLADDSVGAGLGLDGTAQTDTDQGHFTRPLPSENDLFQIDINFGPQVRQHPDIMAGVERAARMWERILEDPITVTIDFELDSAALPDDGTRDEGTFQIPGDDTIGGGALYVATPEEIEIPFDEIVGELKTDARDHEAFVNDIPEFSDIDVDFPRTLENPFTLDEDMLLTTANYKALFGDESGAFIETPSEFDPREATDGSVLINEGALGFRDWSIAPLFYDFDRSDGIQQNKYDFTGMMASAIGRILGFRSSIEEVRFALSDAAEPREIPITPMDLFRLEPGEGGSNFADAPRALDPGQQSHVFYDGGIFDPADLPNELRLEMGDIPLLADEIGNDELIVEGNGIQTSYEHSTNLNGTYLGLGQAFQDVDEEFFITDQDRAVFDLIGYDVIGGPVAGDWRGIEMETFTHDRNVAVITEFEDLNQEVNAVPSEAQFVGAIAKDSSNSDENLRAGIEIHGFINSPGDVDVFSFDAVPGTELWIDIDRTSQSLDTVVELVNANGITLARSDDSHAEFLELEERFETSTVPTFNLQKSPFLSIDHYSVNPKDAGLRVVIPGDSDEPSPFFVRVRSSSNNLNILSGGLTEGRYELQLRTQELDEVPGTSIQYADIRYAVDGVRARGLPRHSPLTGEVAEDDSANDTLEFESYGASSDSFRDFGYIPVRVDAIYAGQETQFAPFRYPVFENGFPQPQWVGNVLTSDQGAIAISGSLDPIQDPEGLGLSLGAGLVDVDYYMFTVDFDAIQQTGTLEAPETANLIFDIDYADGLGRANTSISIYKASFFTDYRTEYDAFIGSDNFGAIGTGVLNSGNGGLVGDLELPDISSIPVIADILPPGDLVAFSEDGGDRDDLPGPVTDPSDPTNLQDRSRGSVGDLDPLIGPIALPQGTYILAVEPNRVQNNPVLDQYSEKLPLNPFLRGEPLSSLNRVVDQDFDLPVIPEPELPVLLDESGFVPLTLADVPLFISEEGGDGTNIYTVDTFQGGLETHVGTLRYQVNSEGEPIIDNDEGPDVLNVGDIVLAERNVSPNGPDILNVEERLFGFTLGATDAEAGNYLTISTENATAGCLLVDPADVDQCAALDAGGGGGGGADQALGDDLIQTYTIDPEAEPPEEGEPRETVRVGDDGEGVNFQALTLLQQGPRSYTGYAIGSRNDPQIQNVLYTYDHTTGNAISDPADNREDPPVAPESEDQDEFFGFSDIVERGVLFTDRDLSAPWSTDSRDNADTSLVVTAASDAGQPLILDGQTFDVDDNGTVTTYEFNIVSDFLVQSDAANGLHFDDGDTFTVDGVVYEIESGAVIVVDDFAELQDGEVIAIADYRSEAPSLLIEVDTDDAVADGRVSLPMGGLADATEFAARLADVINAQGSFSGLARASGARISLVYDGGVAEGSNGLSVEGGNGIVDGNVPIVIEDFFGSDRMAATLGAAVPGSVVSGNRISFGAPIDLTDVDSGILERIDVNEGVTDGNTAISITPASTRLEVAQAVANAVGGDAFDGVVTVPQGTGVTFANAGSFEVAGESPGGQITGMTFVGSTMYAVSDRGGLFIINGYDLPNDVGTGAIADYLEQSSQLLGTPFSGLTVGPQEVANGAYANMLFATDSRGNLHAFDLDGVPQPIFADGATSISTGVSSPNGLQFSTAQTNLWQVTDQRGLDPGHSGGNSLRFGDADRNINYPGGTQGTIVSNQVDLSAYTDADRPALYFNYFMTAEEAEGPTKRDAFRVFISDDSEDADAKGTWHLLATSDELPRNFDNDPEDTINVDVQTLWNNSYQDVPSLVRTGDGIDLTENDPDVYIPANGLRDTWPVQGRDDDNPPPFSPDQAGFVEEPLDWLTYQGVGFPQLNETAGVWRQARIDLSDFAGSDALRLRFDFSTAASFDLGNFGGIELKAIEGNKLEDGDSLTVDGVTFEVDFGLSVISPAARSIEEGETLVFLDNDRAEYRFEFTTDEFLTFPDAIPVTITNFASADEVATALADAVNGLGVGMTGSLIGNRITFEGVEVVFYEAGSSFQVEGAGLDVGVAEGNVPLLVSKTMTSNEVAQVLGATFVEHLGEGIDANYVVVGNVVKMYGDTVSDQGPFGLATELRGDEWGSFVTPFGEPAYRGMENHFLYYELEEEFEIDERVLPHLPPQADQDPDDFPLDFATEFEGVYLDDLIIGFRTRGEDVQDLREPHLFTAGWDEPSFDDEPRVPNVFAYYPQTLDIDFLDPSLATGEYRLEIRVASQEDTFLNQLDRTVPNVTLIAPSGGQVFDGKLFELTDGRRNLIFEYNDLALENGVGMADHIAIDYTTDMTEGEMAVVIRDAINALGDSFLLVATTGDGATDVVW